MSDNAGTLSFLAGEDVQLQCPASSLEVPHYPLRMGSDGILGGSLTEVRACMATSPPPGNPEGLQPFPQNRI